MTELLPSARISRLLSGTRDYPKRPRFSFPTIFLISGPSREEGAPAGRCMAMRVFGLKEKEKKQKNGQAGKRFSSVSRVSLALAVTTAISAIVAAANANVFPACHAAICYSSFLHARDRAGLRGCCSRMMLDASAGWQLARGLAALNSTTTVRECSIRGRIRTLLDEIIASCRNDSSSSKPRGRVKQPLQESH